MNLIIIILTVVILITAIAAAVFIILKRLDSLKTERENDKGFLFLQNQLSELQKIIDAKLHQSHQATLQQLDHGLKANKEFIHLIKEQTEKLTRLDETNKQVIGFTEQLQR